MKKYVFGTDDEPLPAPDWLPRRGAKDAPPRKENFLTGADLGDRADPLEEARLAAALMLGRNDLSYDDFVRTTFAVKAAYPNSGPVYAAWLQFGLRWPDNTHEWLRETWDSAKPDGSVTLGTVFHLLRQRGEAAFPTEPEIVPIEDAEVFEVTSLALYAGKPTPVREFYVQRVFPRYTTSVLSGAGGVGKSTLLHQLCIASAIGERWCGCEVVQGRTVIFTVEDDPDELHICSKEICAAYGVTFEEARECHVRSWVEEPDVILGRLSRETGVITATDVYQRLRKTISVGRPDLVVLDNVADVFGGDENVRNQAKAFANLLNRLCTEFRCTILLVSHPSLSGIADGSGRSGSTGWPNAVRSFWYLRRPKVDEQDMTPEDRDRRELANVKANRGQDGEVIELRRKDGIFEVEGGGGQDRFDRMAWRKKRREVFLKLYRKHRALGAEMTTASGSRSSAVTVFAKDRDREGVGRKDLQSAMEELVEDGTLVVDVRGRPSHRKAVLIWGEEVPEGTVRTASEPLAEPMWKGAAGDPHTPSVHTPPHSGSGVNTQKCNPETRND